MNTSVYNNLVTTFDTRYKTKYAHDTRELRSVVKRIRKQTQTSPIYLLDFTDKKQSFVLGVKQNSMKVAESLQTLADESEDSLFFKKKARSSDVEQVGVELVEGEEQQLPGAFSIQVKQLANSQINQGKEYYETGKGLPAGSYQFKVTVNDVGYDFQYNIKKDANHREVIQGLAGFITKARIGIRADAYAPESGKIAMRLESTDVGTPDGRETFRLEDKAGGSSSRGLVEYYGLNHVVRMPHSAVFDLNGVEKTSLSNEFVLGKAVKVSLRQPSDEKAMVDYHPDSRVILDGINEFVSGYNQLIGTGLEYQQEGEAQPKLVRELTGLMKSSVNELESCGITFDKDGFMEVDTSLAQQAIEEGDMQKIFSMENKMVPRLLAKTDAVKINPMEYVDKKIVNYPDFSKPPRGYSYITSLYSGLIFNYYC